MLFQSNVYLPLNISKLLTYSKPMQQILLNNSSSPDPKSHTLRRMYTVSNRDYHI